MKRLQQGTEKGGKVGGSQIFLRGKSEDGEGGLKGGEGQLIGSELFKKGRGAIPGIREREKIDEIAVWG